MNIYVATLHYQQDFSAYLNDVIDRSVNDPGSSDIRYIASDLCIKDARIWNEAANYVMTMMEWLFINNQLNLNNQNQIFQAVDNAYNDCIPYVVVNYAGHISGMTPPVAAGLRQDAGAFKNNLQRMIADLTRFYTEEQRGYSMRNGYSGGYERAGQGAHRRYEMTGRHTSRSPGYQMGERHYETPATSDLVRDLPSMANNHYGQTTADAAHRTDVRRQSMYQDRNDDVVYDLNGKVISRQTAADQRDYHAIVDEPPVHQQATPRSSSTIVYDNITSTRGNEDFDAAPVQEETKGNAPMGSEMRYLQEMPRQRGIGFDWGNLGEVDGKWYHAMHTGLSLDTILVRKQHAPVELYPVDFDQVKFTRSGDGYLVYEDEQGVPQKEMVFFRNPNEPYLRAFDTSRYRCEIVLDDLYLPVFKIIPLTKEEIMDYEQHKVPGKPVAGNVLSVLSTYPEREPDNIVEEARSLALSEEELAQQEEELLASGKAIDEHVKALFVEDDVVIVQNQDLGTEVTNLAANHPEHSCIQMEVETIKSFAAPGATKEEVTKVLRLLRHPTCTSAKAVLDMVYEPLVAMKALPAARWLSDKMDDIVNGILFKLGLGHLTVDDVMNCEDDLFCDQYVDSRLKARYDTLISEAIENLVDPTMLKVYMESLDGKVEVPFATNDVAIYLRRTAAELNVPKATEEQPWFVVSGTHKDQWVLWEAIQAYLLRQQDSKQAPCNLYVVTQDGLVIEVDSEVLRTRKFGNEVLVRLLS